MRDPFFYVTNGARQACVKRSYQILFQALRDSEPRSHKWNDGHVQTARRSSLLSVGHEDLLSDQSHQVARRPRSNFPGEYACILPFLRKEWQDPVDELNGWMRLIITVKLTMSYANDLPYWRSLTGNVGQATSHSHQTKSLIDCTFLVIRCWNEN